MEKVIIDPVTRIEGHLKVEVTLDQGIVKEARTSGTLFRGFEIILKGRDPRDASQITQRVCGVCPIAHATASVFALDQAFGLEDKIPSNARIIRNLILGSNFLQSNILHFYHLAALDFVDLNRLARYEGEDARVRALKEFLAGGNSSPFFPRYEGDYRLDDRANEELASHYLLALEVRRKTHEMLAIFGGKMPHNVGMVAGGVTEKPTVDKISAFLWRVNEIREFIDNVYFSDVMRIAEKYGDYLEMGASGYRFLSYGAFNLNRHPIDQTKRSRLYPQGLTDSTLKLADLEPERIAEQVKNSWYEDEITNRHPSRGDTVPSENKSGGYSWIKAPRYDGEPCEVGPLARLVVGYSLSQPPVRDLVEKSLSGMKLKFPNLLSCLGRHLARALDTKLVADAMAEWVLQLKPGEPIYVAYELPEEAEGMGLTEAPRGSVGHWIRIKRGVIDNYQLVVPTTWNASPRDDSNQPGPIEKALTGIKVRDSRNPLEVVRIIRSFDPCLACAVHFVTPKGRELEWFRIS